jgi:hypothetical protein
MEIDWSSAEVRDGTLTVELTEKPQKDWLERLDAVVERLGHDGVKFDEQRISVQGVQPGGEGDVRHLLESAVLQVNADLGPDEPEENGDEPSEGDRQMTQAFRAFGG